jgi:8-oxo-dGTP diphosphatase
MAEPLPQRPYTSVHLILKNDANDILLFHRIDNSAWHGLYVPVAGKVEKGEDIYTAMCREAFEEAGLNLEIKDLKLACFFQKITQPDNSDYSDVFEFYFIASANGQTPKVCEPTIAEKMAFYPLNNLPQPLSPYIKLALDNIAKGNMFAVIPKPLV